MEKKVLILEDNDKTAVLIKRLLKECGSPVKVYIEKDVEHAYALVMQNKIQLFIVDIILDITKPGDTSGMKFVESIRKIEKYRYTPLIFITSLQDPEIYAYRELHCYGYIEKPFEIEPVKKLLNEALECNIAGEDEHVLHFRKDGILYPIQCSEIVYAQSTNHTICFYLTNGTKFKISYKTCRQILEEAEYDEFIQCSRGTIVNRKHIEHVDLANGVVTLRGDVKVEIGIRYKQKFIEALQW